MQLGAKETENERFSHYFTKTYRKTASLIANSLKAVSKQKSTSRAWTWRTSSFFTGRNNIRSRCASRRNRLPVRQKSRFGLPVCRRSLGLCVVFRNNGQAGSSRSEAGPGHGTCSLCMRKGQYMMMNMFWNFKTLFKQEQKAVTLQQTSNFRRWTAIKFKTRVNLCSNCFLMMMESN